MHFKPKFIKKYSQLTDFQAYKVCIETFPRKSIRVNTLATTSKKLLTLLEKQGWVLEQVPWCQDGFYIEHREKRRDIGNTPEHQQGLFFAQKSVSMIPPLALNPEAGDKVLDACAAPGGKTSHLASLMNNKGIIVANEPDAYRINGLIANLDRCSVKNTIVTKMDLLAIKNEIFDKILLDAPCSGSGLIRGKTQRSLAILKMWNQNYINKMSHLQKKMIRHAWSLLKKGGVLVYSTCSLEPEENEDVINHLLAHEHASLQPINLPVKTHSKYYLRIWPQDNNTEGFFVAKLRKEKD